MKELNQYKIPEDDSTLKRMLINKPVKTSKTKYDFDKFDCKLMSLSVFKLIKVTSVLLYNAEIHSKLLIFHHLPLFN